jgi:hypothetical protein
MEDLSGVELSNGNQVSAHFHQVWTAEELSGGPVGILTGGCDGEETMALNKVAYRAGFPIVSGGSVAEMSRAAYPNFWRTSAPDTDFAPAWFTMTRILGFERMTAVIGETRIWRPLARAVARAADDFGVELDGTDLSGALDSQFSGYQISLESSESAQIAAKGISKKNNRIVLVGLYDSQTRTLMCEMHRLGLDNFIFMVVGWLGLGWWRVEDTGCSSEEVTRMAWGFISASIQRWRSDMSTVLACTESMTAEEFRAEWYDAMNVTSEPIYSMNQYGMPQPARATTTADAVCMYAHMLHVLLFESNFTVEDLQQRSDGAYNHVQGLFAEADFQGVSGRISFQRGSSEPTSSVLIQHLQSFTSEFVDVASLDMQSNRLSFYGIANLTFKLPGETYFAGPSGGASIVANPATFAICPNGSILDHSSNMCQPCPDDMMFVKSIGACACRPGWFKDSGSGGCTLCGLGNYCPFAAKKMMPCPAGTYAGSAGTAQCELCPVGTYANISGATRCTSCSSGKNNPDLYATQSMVLVSGIYEWVPTTGAESATACGCKKGAYDNEGECELCGEGMACAGMGEVVILPNYFASVDNPGFVWRCYGTDYGRCPGGPPGTCRRNRVNSSLACIECIDGYAPAMDGSCSKCDTASKIIFPSTCLALILVIGGLHFLWNTKTEFVEASETAQASLTLGVCWSMVQQLGVLSLVRIDWPSEVSHLIALMTWAIVDITPLQVDCIGLRDETLRYLTFLLIPVFIAVSLVLWWIVGLVYQKLRRRSSMSLCHALNSWGLIMQAIFVSVTSASISSFRCEAHPNGVSTILSYPDVMCQGPEYLVMLLLSVASTLLFVVGPTAACLWCIVQAPRRFSACQNNFWVATRFLFFKFRPDRYWYGPVILLRALLVTLAICVTDDPFKQLLCINIVLIVSAVIHASLEPYSDKIVNVLETLELIGILIIATMAFSFLPPSKTMSRSMVGPVLMVVVAFVLTGSLLVVVARLFDKALRVRFRQEKGEDEVAPAFCSLLEDKLVPAFLIFAGTSKERLIDLMSNATYTDRRTLNCAAEFIFQELCRVPSVGRFFQASRLPSSLMRGCNEALKRITINRLLEEAMSTIHEHKATPEAQPGRRASTGSRVSRSSVISLPSGDAAACSLVGAGRADTKGNRGAQTSDSGLCDSGACEQWTSESSTCLDVHLVPALWDASLETSPWSEGRGTLRLSGSTAGTPRWSVSNCSAVESV